MNNIVKNMPLTQVLENIEVLEGQVHTDSRSEFLTGFTKRTGYWNVREKRIYSHSRYGHNRNRKNARYNIERSTIRRPFEILNYDHHTA